LTSLPGTSYILASNPSLSLPGSSYAYVTAADPKLCLILRSLSLFSEFIARNLPITQNISEKPFLIANSDENVKHKISEKRMLGITEAGSLWLGDREQVGNAVLQGDCVSLHYVLTKRERDSCRGLLRLIFEDL
jgi:hypothetical protein